jgi:hypothetical protein
MNSQNNGQPKNKAINFRVHDNVWKAAAERAALAGKGVNEWARDELTGRLDESHGLTPGERLIYTEINNLRNLVETMLLAGINAANSEQYAEALERSMDEREAAAREYFAQLAEVGRAATESKVSDLEGVS